MQEPGVTEENIGQAVAECLSDIGIPLNTCKVKVLGCRNFKEHGAGAYVFFDELTVYYVGESDDVANRLREHCTPTIGGSEGVVRFLMYYLDEVCSKKGEWEKHNAMGRENFVKNLLRQKIGGLKIYVVICNELVDEREGGGRAKNRLRRTLEHCLVSKLKPALQQDFFIVKRPLVLALGSSLAKALAPCFQFPRGLTRMKSVTSLNLLSVTFNSLED